MDLTQPGSRIDDYTVEEVIARTQTSSILRAREVHNGGIFTIKLPHLEVEGDLHFYQRFLREKSICESLNHPAVVKAFPKREPSRNYIVLEFTEGKTLRQVLHEHGKLPVERAVRIAVGICEALEYIHSQGVVHRDVKPENILVDAEDRIKLIDFGIASQAGARRVTFGKFSQVMGTPDYIAPEQVRGKRGDARTDVYSAGVILYEMITGETPFSGTNPFVVMNSRLINDPTPPREIDPNISLELEEALLTALERQPKDRYTSARDFANDLLHPERVRFAERPSKTERRKVPLTRMMPFYGMLALIPIVVLGLMLLIARHG